MKRRGKLALAAALGVAGPLALMVSPASADKAQDCADLSWAIWYHDQPRGGVRIVDSEGNSPYGNTLFQMYTSMGCQDLDFYYSIG